MPGARLGRLAHLGPEVVGAGGHQGHVGRHARLLRPHHELDVTQLTGRQQLAEVVVQRALGVRRELRVERRGGEGQ